ncbi:MAG: ABC transporter ATP-binding protein [Rhizobiales bacterium]|nr:ABC transporter ATP-binding protein [Hyphomicrobiales bacterium]
MAHLSARDLWVSFAIVDYQHVSLKQTALRLGRRPKTPPPVVHALKGVSFEAADGDRIGLIGHNGSGKSTILRALAGIYLPTRGTLLAEGTRGSLFNVSAGLDPDATGNENITLLGVSAGMSLRQIAALREEIAAFADLGDALSRPVRTYSAGMQLRLAFGVSTAIPADILLIDEVIGAGDSRFQSRATDRIKRLMGQAKILVLASHAEGVMRDNCNRGLVFEQGNIVFDGPIEDALAFARAPQAAPAAPAPPPVAPPPAAARRPRVSRRAHAAPTLFPTRRPR